VISDDNHSESRAPASDLARNFTAE